jgi:hypothetical protein
MLSVKAQAELAHSKESAVLEQDNYYPVAGYPFRRFTVNSVVDAKDILLDDIGVIAYP